MKTALFLLFCMALCSCSSRREGGPESHGLVISEENPDKKTALTKQNIMHLAQVYDLGPLLFTRKVIVTPALRPTTREALIVDPRFAEKPNKLLSVFLHAQLHTWLSLNQKRAAAAVADLKKIYPKIPADVRPGDRINGHAHLIICYLEHLAVSFYLGKKQGRSVIAELMKKDKIFPWTYYQVLNKNFAIKQVVEKHELVPEILN